MNYLDFALVNNVIEINQIGLHYTLEIGAFNGLIITI